MPKRVRVERTRGGGKYTESQFWGFIRSGLRSKYQRWAPRYAVLAEARRPSKDKKNLKLKWQFQCSICKKWHPQKNVEVDHIVPCGSLRSFEDLPGFCERLFVEEEGLRVLCKKCHVEVTNSGRSKPEMS